MILLYIKIIRVSAMTLRHIKIFLSVFQNGSVTKAARELRIAQPSASLAIKELEEFYGAKLFDRIGRRIYPTQTGRRLYDYALKICGLFDEANRSVKNPDALGEIRIGASIATGTILLPDIINRYKKTRPEITVKAIIGNSDEIERKVLANEIDVGFTEKQPESAEIIADSFGKDRLCAVCAPNCPLAKMESVSPQELAAEPFLTREKGSAVRDITDAYFAVCGLSISPVMESTGTEALLNAAEKGIGISILPYMLAKERIESGALSELPLKPQINRDLNIIRHKSKFLSPAIEDFLALWKENNNGSSPEN